MSGIRRGPKSNIYIHLSLPCVLHALPVIFLQLITVIILGEMYKLGTSSLLSLAVRCCYFLSLFTHSPQPPARWQPQITFFCLHLFQLSYKRTDKMFPWQCGCFIIPLDCNVTGRRLWQTDNLYCTLCTEAHCLLTPFHCHWIWGKRSATQDEQNSKRACLSVCDTFTDIHNIEINGLSRVSYEQHVTEYINSVHVTNMTTMTA
jgi:hypothetical protein